MLHVLCVHGAQQTSEIFEHQLSRLTHALRDVAVLEYVDAPHVLPRAHDDDAVTTRSWCRPRHAHNNDDSDSDDDDYADGDRALDAALQRRRYDVVLGFSQGALMLCRLFARTDAVARARRRSVRAVVLAGAPDPRRAHAHGTLFARFCSSSGSKQPQQKTTTATTVTADDDGGADMCALFGDDVPSLHLVGERDAIVPAAESVAFARACGARATLLLHDHGHCVPQQQRVCAAVRALCLDVAHRNHHNNNGDGKADVVVVASDNVKDDAFARHDEARAQELALLTSMYGDDAVVVTSHTHDATVRLRLLTDDDIAAALQCDNENDSNGDNDDDVQRVLQSLWLQLYVPARYPATPPRVDVVGGPTSHNTSYEHWRSALVRSCVAYIDDNNSNDATDDAAAMQLLPTYLHANTQAVEQLPALLRALSTSPTGGRRAQQQQQAGDNNNNGDDNNNGSSDGCSDMDEEGVDEAVREQRIADAEAAATALLLRRRRRHHGRRQRHGGSGGGNGSRHARLPQTCADDAAAATTTTATADDLDASSAVAAARALSSTALLADAMSHRDGSHHHNNNDDDDDDSDSDDDDDDMDVAADAYDDAMTAAESSSSGSTASAESYGRGAGGSWTLTIGLIGKPSAGKSTFYNAITDPESEAAAARVAAFPFTTIEPNVGAGYAPVYCPCSVLLPSSSSPAAAQTSRLTAGFATCDAAYGHVHVAHVTSPHDVHAASAASVAAAAAVRHRRHAVRVKDVAGLVRGAYRGRGRGNRFLNDLCDADVLVHVVDGASVTDAEGVACAPGRGSALHDVAWVRGEVHHWIYDNIAHKWPALRRQPRRLYGMFSGYRSSPAVVARVLRGMGIRNAHALETRLRTWTAAQLHLLVALYIRVRFPLVVAVNKADVMPHAATVYAQLRRAYPHEVLVPMSARVECDLLTLRKRSLVAYAAGDVSFVELPQPSPPPCHRDGGAMTAQDAAMLARVRDFFAQPCDDNDDNNKTPVAAAASAVQWVGSTGVQRVLAAAVARCAAMLVYPVATLQPAVSTLRDCYAFKPGTTADAVFVRLTYAQLLHGKLVRFELADVAVHTAESSNNNNNRISNNSSGGGVVTLKRTDVLPTHAALVRILTNKRQLAN